MISILSSLSEVTDTEITQAFHVIFGYQSGALKYFLTSSWFTTELGQKNDQKKKARKCLEIHWWKTHTESDRAYEVAVAAPKKCYVSETTASATLQPSQLFKVP